jgi:hypothetical protein
MRRRSYSGWKLRHVEGTWMTNLDGLSISLTECEDALRASIPSLSILTVMIHETWYGSPII